MNRKIQFRGKHLSTNEWVYGYYVSYHVSSENGLQEIPAICNDGEGHRNNIRYWKDINKETIGQYTGVTDENGTEVYEGDVLQIGTFDNKFLGYVTWSERAVAWIVRTGYLSANIEWRLGSVNSSMVFVVKGNIHENPELIKNEG